MVYNVEIAKKYPDHPPVLSKLRWNPLDPEQLLCCSDTHILIVKYTNPQSEHLLNVSRLGGIDDASFAPKYTNCKIS